MIYFSFSACPQELHPRVERKACVASVGTLSNRNQTAPASSWCGHGCFSRHAFPGIFAAARAVSPLIARCLYRHRDHSFFFFLSFLRVVLVTLRVEAENTLVWGSQRELDRRGWLAGARRVTPPPGDNFQHPWVWGALKVLWLRRLKGDHEQPRQGRRNGIERKAVWAVDVVLHKGECECGRAGGVTPVVVAPGQQFELYWEAGSPSDVVSALRRVCCARLLCFWL